MNHSPYRDIARMRPVTDDDNASPPPESSDEESARDPNSFIAKQLSLIIERLTILESK